MNILFTAFSITKGMGGHLRSLLQIYDKICEYHNVYILIFGQIESTIFKDYNKYYFINTKKKNFFHIKKEIDNILIKKDIELIHSFDDFSYIICQLGVKKKYILTRCGGSNPKKFPHARFITCFSLENYNYLKKRFKKSNISLIPNRVNNFYSNTKLINKLENVIHKNGTKDIILLRISRIDDYYLKSIEQSINLHISFQKYAKKKISKLIILGEIYNQEIYNTIKKRINKISNIFLITDKKFTEDAKKIIGVSDIVIGTGRGLMEASSKGKILFAPVNNSKLPELITENNFKLFFYYNFSERTLLPNKSIDVKSVIKYVLNNSKKISEFSFHIFNKYFFIDEGIKHYLKIYECSVLYNHKKENLPHFIFYLIYIKGLLYKNKIKKHEDS